MREELKLELKLEPCPFCGGAAAASKVYQETGAGDGRYALGVGCNTHGCGVAPKVWRFGPYGYKQPGDLESNDLALSLAVTAWNTRAKPPQPADDNRRASVAEAFRKGAMAALGCARWDDADDFFTLVGMDYAQGKPFPSTMPQPRQPADANHEALVEALGWFARHRKSITADVSSAHSGRGNGASQWMREDDSEFRSDLRAAFDKAEAALAAFQSRQEEKQP